MIASSRKPTTRHVMFRNIYTLHRSRSAQYAAKEVATFAIRH